MTAVRDPFEELGPLVGSGGELNVAHELARWAERTPDAPAVRTASGSEWRTRSYADLEQESDRWAHELAARGLRPGDRTCVFVRAGYELICVTYALFKVGAVPVLIDPGMGLRRLLSCVQRMHPRGFVGIPAAQGVRRVFRRAFRSVEVAWTVPRAGVRLGPPRGAFPIEECSRDAEAAVLFTSGSTGPAKGAVYTHETFRAQLAALRALYDLEPGEVDVACFPLFALFDTALGLTSVFPNLDPSRPGRCDPESIVRALEENGASLTFGSPAIWKRGVPGVET